MLIGVCVCVCECDCFFLRVASSPSSLSCVVWLVHELLIKHSQCVQHLFVCCLSLFIDCCFSRCSRPPLRSSPPSLLAPASDANGGGWPAVNPPWRPRGPHTEGLSPLVARNRLIPQHGPLSPPHAHTHTRFPGQKEKEGCVCGTVAWRSRRARFCWISLPRGKRIL